MTTHPTPAEDARRRAAEPVYADPVVAVMAADPQRSRGRYVYTRDGAAIAVDERFVLGEIAPGVLRVRSTRITGSPAARLEADVRMTVGGTTATIRWVGSSPGVASSARARYSSSPGGGVVVTREVDGVVHDEVTARGTQYPLLRVFTGPLVVASVGGRDVVVPEIADPRDRAAFLSPTTSRRTAQPLGQRPVMVDGVEREGTAYHWVGGAYGEDGADFVVDPGGLLLAYSVTQPSGRWDVTLAEVSGPWPSLPAAPA